MSRSRAVLSQNLADLPHFLAARSLACPLVSQPFAHAAFDATIYSPCDSFAFFRLLFYFFPSPQLNYLLHLPTTPPEKKAEVAGRLRDVIVDLAVSLGLERSTILQQVNSLHASAVSILCLISPHIEAM